MMCSGKSLFLGAVTAVLLLHLCSRSEASNFDCCLRYTDHIIHPKFIVGFMQQLASEACDIDAVIFHTKKRLAVCADPKKKWVKQAVRILRYGTFTTNKLFYIYLWQEQGNKLWIIRSLGFFSLNIVEFFQGKFGLDCENNECIFSPLLHYFNFFLI
ncbi:C-C motif chemokine 20 isoform X2 [Trichechus manatus latirostris]|uniref:C-C motif chemokine n=1 Tax=Trichechus manatus latirostris TaxID=127582 RepID=A0A2Y9RV75_TRIMA|nr:C-C motif chemokine 20 isoform X2 [Trichechus manatus latirostris]